MKETLIQKAEKQIVAPEAATEEITKPEDLNKLAAETTTDINQKIESFAATYPAETIDKKVGDLGMDKAAIAAERTALDSELARINQEAITKGALAKQEVAAVEGKTEDETKKAEAKFEALTQDLSKLTPDAMPGFIEEYNKTNEGGLKNQELRLLKSENGKLLVINEAGKLEQVEVTKENAKAVLMEIKKKDETLKGKSYDLRKEILKISDGVITSHEAYTYAVNLPGGKEFDSYMANPENWLPDRIAHHEEIINEEIVKARALSKRSGTPPKSPRITAMRGNTASGKTTAVKRNESFSPILDENGEPSGAINPDTQKTELINLDKVGEKSITNHSQTHEESSMLAKKIQEKILNDVPPLSMVVDKRLNKEKNINDILETAKEKDKEVAFCDVDVPFETSLIRVLGRERGGDAPLVGFDQVAEGFEGIRENRTKFLRQVNQNPSVKDYVLYGTDENGNSVEVARKANGKFELVDGRKDLLKQALDKNPQIEIQKMSNAIIDDSYIQGIINKTPEKFRQKIQSSLEKYKGRTFKEALDLHAKS